MDPTQTITLNRLLQRLDHTLLSSTANPDATLRSSSYERTRVGANLETARQLLLAQEKQSSTVRANLAQKQQFQADLQRKRELVRRLGAKLEELNALGEAEDEDEDESDEDEDDEEDEDGDVRQSYGPARTDAEDGIDAGSEAKELLRGPAEAQQAQAQAQQELRSRKSVSAADNRSAASTTAREKLLAGAGRKQAHPDLETTEALMSHNRSEQEALTQGLLGLARSLKESANNFGSSMETDKEVVKATTKNLEKSSVGMDATGRRMGTLRRMSEGQGWWGRVKLYGCIFALWVFLFLVVFLGPKLRF